MKKVFLTLAMFGTLTFATTSCGGGEEAAKEGDKAKTEEAEKKATEEKAAAEKAEAEKKAAEEAKAKESEKKDGKEGDAKKEGKAGTAETPKEEKK